MSAQVSSLSTADTVPTAIYDKLSQVCVCGVCTQTMTFSRYYSLTYCIKGYQSLLRHRLTLTYLSYLQKHIYHTNKTFIPISCDISASSLPNSLFESFFLQRIVMMPQCLKPHEMVLGESKSHNVDKRLLHHDWSVIGIL